MAYTFAHGSGTASDPYLVATAADLNGVRDYLSAHFRQTADIDLSGYGNWVPIGNDTNNFIGTYDGAGYTVSNMLNNRPSNVSIGLFGFANNAATIKNLGVIGVYVSGSDYTGGLVGRIHNSSTITNCYSTGTVSGNNYVGGLVGYYGSSSTITNCYSTGRVTGSYWVGGLAGRSHTSTITNCYSTGGVTGSVCVGGLVGYHIYTSTITNCYSTGTVSGNNNYVGGLVGSNKQSCTITNCYSTGRVTGNADIGGLAGINDSGTITSSYYDSQTSGRSDTGKGDPKTTAEMKTQSTFVNWDFDEVWGITDSYPFLGPVYPTSSGTGVVVYTGTATGCVKFAPILSATMEHVATGSGAVSVLAKGAGEVVYAGTARINRAFDFDNIADAEIRFFSMMDCLYFYNGQEYYYYKEHGGGKVTSIAYVPTITLGRAPTGGGAAYEELNYLSNSWKDSFSGTADTLDYSLSFAGLSDTAVKAWVNGEIKAETTDFTVDRATGKVSFNSAPGEGTNNVVIQAEKTGLMSADYILKATQFIVYGGKNDNRVFACRGNTRYHSGLNDPTYWPENNYAAITSDAEDLVGFGKMYDYLINLKEFSLTFTTIDSDPSGNVIFPIYPLNDEYGCLAPDSIQPVANGLIFLAQTKTGAPAGVVFLSPTTVRNQLNVQVISEDINTSMHAGITGLTEYSAAELAAAKSYVHDKKYWLKVGDKVWILDLRQSDFSMGKFCWYPYDGAVTNANCFLEYDGNFYIGDVADGVIYKEVDGGLNDGPAAINSRWTSPIIFCGSRSWIKDFEELHIVFGPQVMADHKLTFITDDGKEEVDIAIEGTRVFSYANINYGAFTYGSNPYPSKQTELVGYSAEYLQWIIANDELNQGLTILAQELDYLWGERS